MRCFIIQEILVDINGYNQFFKELYRLQEISRQNSALGSEVYQNAVGDGWHDNFAFEESMRESRMITKRIDDLLEKKEKLKIINDLDKKIELVNLGDTVDVEIKYSDDDIEREIITLTGNYIPNTNNSLNEITLNSPIGKAIFKAKIGTSVSYYVEDNEIFITLISKK